MTLITWSTNIERAWIIVGIVVSTAVAAVSSACPRDVSTKAHSCFTDYSSHFQNMQNSPQKLCCGLDVETLRAFCQSYTSAMKCVNQLKEECPGEAHHAIDKSLVNLDGSRAGLHELCSDDSIIESYAMYQSCFTFAGGGSELCFQTHLNSSLTSNIRFLSKVTINKMEKFCSDMRNTVECVHKNIKNMCGEKAARLAAILVKPMVRQSTDCNYSVINHQEKSTKRPYPGQRAYISDDHGGNKNKHGVSGHNNGTGEKLLHNRLLILPVLVTVFLLLLLNG